MTEVSPAGRAAACVILRGGLRRPKTVEGETARLVESRVRPAPPGGRRDGLVVDPDAPIIGLKPDVEVDATIPKKNLGTRITARSWSSGWGWVSRWQGRACHHRDQPRPQSWGASFVRVGRARHRQPGPHRWLYHRARGARPARRAPFDRKKIGDMVKAGDVVAYVEAGAGEGRHPRYPARAAA